MSDKIQEHHLKRKAILYVRQSSQYQVLHNQESRKLQYAMDSGFGGETSAFNQRLRPFDCSFRTRFSSTRQEMTSAW